MAEWTVLHIRVQDRGKELINLSIPLGLLKLAGKFIPEKELKDYGIDLEEILSFVKESSPDGKIVDIEDKGTKTIIKVFLE